MTAVGRDASPPVVGTARAPVPRGPNPRQDRNRRQPALDGLRGLAVTAVILNHFRPTALPGGWLGVDVFFVLSGFLITSLLLREHTGNGRIDLGRFYSRRARRLLPALFLLLAVLAVAARFAPNAAGFQDLRGDGLAALAYVANWHFIMNGASYFGAFAPSPLRHLWSLSVEEQFYVLWPLVLIVVLRRYGARAVGVVALVLATASAAAMALVYGNGSGAARAYFGTDTHAHSVLLGCALAALAPALRRWPFTRTATSVALLGIGAAMFVLTGTGAAAYRGGIAAVALLTTVVIAGTVSPGARGPANWFLELRPLRALGRISYGLYLWHWPILVFLTATRVGVSGWPLIAVQLACTLALALASFFLLERPVLAGWPHPRWSWLGVPAAVTAVIVALALVVPSIPAPFAAAEQQASVRNASTAPLAPPPRRLSGTAGQRYHPRRVVVIGDSVAYTLFPGLRAHEQPANLYFLTAAQTGCPLDIAATEYHHQGAPNTAADLPAHCDWPKLWPAMIKRTDPDLVVALWGLWDLFDHEVDGHWLTVGTRPWVEHMEQTLQQAIDVVTARGAHMIVLTTPYVLGVSIASVDALNAVYRSVAARDHDRVTVVNIQALVDRLQPQRWDTVHFSASGANVLGAAVVPLIARLAHNDVHTVQARSPAS